MKPRGFTIVELLTSVAIFVLLAGIMMANFRQGDYSEELKSSADLVSANIREAQNKSLSGITAGTSGGYGIYFTSGASSFNTYGDLGATSRRYDSGEEILSVNLRENVSFSATSSIDIYFQIPDGEFYLNGVLKSDPLTLTLGHSVNGKSIDITILPFSGQISVGNIY